jgi:hypothetical protein
LRRGGAAREMHIESIRQRTLELAAVLHPQPAGDHTRSGWGSARLVLHAVRCTTITQRVSVLLKVFCFQ